MTPWVRILLLPGDPGPAFNHPGPQFSIREGGVVGKRKAVPVPGEGSESAALLLMGWCV